MIHQIVGILQDGPDRSGLGELAMRPGGLANGFGQAQQEGNQDQGRQRGDHHGQSPPIGLGDRSAEKEAGRAPDGDAEHEESEGTRAPGRRKEISNPACGGRRHRGLSDGEAEAREEQDGIAGGQRGDGGERAPHDHPSGQQLPAAPRIGELSQRNADDGVQPDEGAPQKSDLRVGEGEFLADGFGQGTENVAIVEVQNVDGDQDVQRAVVFAFPLHGGPQ